jgi:hypothetical protein
MQIHANVIKFRDIVSRRGKKPVDIGEMRKRRKGDEWIAQIMPDYKPPSITHQAPTNVLE